MKAVGKHQVRLLEFANKYPQWHSYTTDRTTLRVVQALELKGYIKTNEFNQFIITYPKEA